MLINFTKMHGLGNDFVVIDLITQTVRLRAGQIRRIADRHLGIGCDQILLIEPPTRTTADFYLRIFNANGDEVEHCGNGARCAARFFYDMGFSNNPTLEADCLAGPLSFVMDEQGDVTVNMGIPTFHPTKVPFTSNTEALQYPITVENAEYNMSVLSMGNPHAVLQVPDIALAPVKKLGPIISKHTSFPKETNVGFMQVMNKHEIGLRVYERSVGETLACGSGACAAVVAGIRLGLLNSPVSVVFSKGRLQITWAGFNTPVMMTGPATRVFIGRFRL
ncbi:MAG TPA: diaminopimelate epimerase [Gammaproteobacteria bacterium]|nr:diaminopimelate epimerase [Gammaproteobacteria bacterium]